MREKKRKREERELEERDGEGEREQAREREERASEQARKRERERAPACHSPAEMPGETAVWGPDTYLLEGPTGSEQPLACHSVDLEESREQAQP